MKGTIEQLPSGSWRLVVMVDGVRHRRTVKARTKTDARKALAQLIIEVGDSPGDGWTADVARLLRLHAARSTSWSPTTRHQWDRLVRQLPDWFTTMWVADVRPATIARLWSDTTFGSAQNYWLHGMLGAAWRRAVQLEWIATNPFEGTRPPAPSRTPIRPPDPEQVKAVLAAADGLWQPVLFRLAATTGARRGELCGLQWADIDAGRNRDGIWSGSITIRRSVAVTASSGVVVKDTKTGGQGHRVVALDEHTARDLAVWRDRARTRANTLQVAWVPSLWVFPADHDPRQPCRPDNVSQAWARTRTRAQVTSVRFHDLRHFAATQLLAAGVDVRTVAGRLGHARTSTTLDRYAAFIPANDQAAAQLLGRLVG